MDLALRWFAAFGISILSTRLLIAIATRKGWIARPRTGRWHRNHHPALYGGTALFLTFFLLSFFFPTTADSRIRLLVGLSAAMFLVGLVDDIWHLSPSRKLMLQTGIAVAAVASGLVYPLRGVFWLDAVATVVWLVGITNAFNLVDNMDGLSAGLACTVTIYLIVFYVAEGFYGYAAILSYFLGTVAGFLVFNFHPAKVFMGDSGSLSIGFFLAGASILEITHLSGVGAFVFVPIFVLSIPILDTIVVTFTRKLHGIPVTRGGVDHSSHRLVFLGMSEKRAVLSLYILSAFSGVVALFLRQLPSVYAPAIVLLFLVFMGLLAVFLGNVPVPWDRTGAVGVGIRSEWLRSILTHPLSLALDSLLISVAYYLAYLLRFDDQLSGANLNQYLRSFPVVAIFTVAGLAIFNVYGNIWNQANRFILYRVGAAVGAATTIAMLCLIFLDRFEEYSRTVFIIHMLLATTFLCGVRFSSAAFMDAVQSSKQKFPRVVLACNFADAAIAAHLVRHLGIWPSSIIFPVSAKSGKYIQGMKVLKRWEDLGPRAGSEHIASVIWVRTEKSQYWPEIEQLRSERKISVQLLDIALVKH